MMGFAKIAMQTDLAEAVFRAITMVVAAVEVVEAAAAEGIVTTVTLVGFRSTLPSARKTRPLLTHGLSQ